MKTKVIPCEIETPDGRIGAKTSAIPSGGEISVFVPDYEIFVYVPLDDLTDDSRRLVFNTRK